MAGNNRGRRLLQGAPGPYMIKDCFLPKSEKLMLHNPSKSEKTADFDKDPN